MFTNSLQRQKSEKVLVVALHLSGTSKEDFDYSLAELDSLVDTAGGEVLSCITQKAEQPNSATYIGSGKLQEVADFLAENPDIDTVIFDNDLNPRQAKIISHSLKNIKVIDRTELILDIFAGRAQTKEAKLEVELAQMEYMMPRLTKLWSHLDRIGGGGIGTRGPGETQLEVDKRLIRNRVSRLKHELKEVEKYRRVQRESRQRNGQKVVAIVGYTNAGKSTLLQTLSKKEVYIEDKLFATLDTLTKKVYVPQLEQEILFSDTVGFIQNLPHHLVKSFKSTLEETKYADIILILVDLSQEDMTRRLSTVYEVLNDLDTLDKPIITVFNKLDLNIQDDLPELLRDYSPAVAISAAKKEGIEELFGLVADTLK